MFPHFLKMIISASTSNFWPQRRFNKTEFSILSIQLMYFHCLEYSQQFTFSNHERITYQSSTTTGTSQENHNNLENFSVTALSQHNEETEKILQPLQEELLNSVRAKFPSGLPVPQHKSPGLMEKNQTCSKAFLHSTGIPAI